MALTNLQKLTVLKHIGLPLTTIDTTRTDYSKIISDRLDYVTGDVQTLIVDVLTRLDGMELRLAKAMTRSGVKRIDDIEFFGAEGTLSEFDVLRGEKRKLIGELADLLNLRGYVKRSGSMQVCVG